MIIVCVEVVVDPGSVDGVRDALATMETETRKEAGCITYAFSVDVTDPGKLRVIERWESTDALAAHSKSEHMAAFMTAVMQIEPKAMDVKAYEIAGEIPLPS